MPPLLQQVEDDPFTPQLQPVDHDPFNPSPADVASMTHYPVAPNPARPIIDAVKAFAGGGLQGVANTQGVSTPEWSQRLGAVLSSPEANAALGVMTPLSGRAFKIIRGPEASDPGYVYHATNIERAQDIADTGSLKTHGPSEFTDQSTWPDGSKQKRNYFTPTAQNTWQFAPEEGQSVLLRIPENAHPLKRESTGDLYSTKPVDASKIEALGNDGNWFPLKPSEESAPSAPGITAFHGSPHDFDRFDISKIGTGEGAQAYGHGLYFAENEGVAKQYRDTLAPHQANAAINRAQRDLSDLQLSMVDEARRRGLLVKSGGDWGDLDAQVPQSIHDEFAPRLAEAQSRVESAQAADRAGRMYQVSINADPEHFLDWDKPLSEQSPKVQEAVSPLRDKLITQVQRKPWSEMEKNDKIGDIRSGDLSGESLLRMLGDDREAVTDQLRAAGIPGIKYLDQGSRFAGTQGVAHLQSQISQLQDMLKTAPAEKAPDIQRALAGRQSELAQAQNGTRNYVVFDDKLIDIMKKYGIAGIGALPAMGAYHFQTAPTDGDPFAGATQP